jgi:hypothetical protein
MAFLLRALMFTHVFLLSDDIKPTFSSLLMDQKIYLKPRLLNTSLILVLLKRNNPDLILNPEYSQHELQI